MIVDDYFKYYINLVNQKHYLIGLKDNFDNTVELLESLDEETGNSAYADGKWTIKQLVMHIVDCERIFNYRALTIAREKNANLPGFDHDQYAFQERHNSKSMQQIIQEYKASKAATISLFEGFNADELAAVGIANSKSIQVEAIGWIAAGHEIHHMKIMREKYLNLV